MKTETLNKLNELYEKSVKGEMSKLCQTGDGKRAFMGSGDGWEELRLDVDTDDCDSKKALASAEFIRTLWNAWPEIRDILSNAQISGGVARSTGETDPK